MDAMFESSSQRPASSSSSSSSVALDKRSKKRAEKEEETDRRIFVKVKNQKKEVCFKVKRTAKLQKIIKEFCDRAGVKYSEMRFLLNGSRFPLTATPNELHMTDGDEIEGMGLRCRGGKAAVG